LLLLLLLLVVVVVRACLLLPGAFPVACFMVTGGAWA
jgi:hypothetical protein